MVRFGAEMVFSSKDSTITDEDIDRIIAKTEDAIKFKMDDSMYLLPVLMSSDVLCSYVLCFPT
jgi:hypothetical protein